MAAETSGEGVGVPDDMMSAISDFDRAADGITTKLATELDATPVPELLYHYTDDAGLRGILEHGKLWLTDIFALNDPSELKHGFSLAVDVLREKSKSGPPETQTFFQSFESLLAQGGLGEIAHYFTCSFSRCGNDLGQWRAYSDNGRGFALGFDGKSIDDAFAATPNANSFNIVYDDERLRRILEHIINLAFPLISLPRGREMTSASIHQYMDDLYASLAVQCVRTVLFFKNPAYSNEKEFRFLQLFSNENVPSDIKYRAGPYVLRRYREFDWKSPAGVLRRIVIGPAADKERAVQFVNDCRRAFYSEPIEIDCSDIPYRAL